MIKISLEHGLCGLSAFAFALYGTVLLGEPFNDIEQGHKMGRLALGIMKRLNAMEVSSAKNDLHSFEIRFYIFEPAMVSN